MSNTVTMKIDDYHKLCSDYIRVCELNYDEQVKAFKEKYVGKRTFDTWYFKPADLEEAVNAVYGHNFGVGTAEERLLFALSSYLYLDAYRFCQAHKYHTLSISTRTVTICMYDYVKMTEVVGGIK